MNKRQVKKLINKIANMKKASWLDPDIERLLSKLVNRYENLFYLPPLIVLDYYYYRNQVLKSITSFKYKKL